MKSVLITGVSSGIGAVTSQFLISKGYHVFGSARSNDQARKIKEELGDAFTPLVFDVRNLEDIQEAVTHVENELVGNNLNAIINNAGIAISGPIQFIDPKDIQDQFDINVVGLINVTQAFLPFIGARKINPGMPGRIINISSVAGTFTMPFQTPYAASKHAVESINDGLRRELHPYGIKVVSVRPGPIKSDIWFKELAKTEGYDETIYAKIWASKNKLIASKEKHAEPTIRVAQAVLEAIESKNPRLYYLVYRNWLQYQMSRVIPSKWMDKIIAKQFKKMLE